MKADLAASLLHSPSVLFLDEPTIGLDLLVKEKSENLYEKINTEEKSLLSSLHMIYRTSIFSSKELSSSKRKKNTMEILLILINF